MDLAERLRSAIELNWARQVEWLQTLVRFRSVRGAETPCQDWLAAEFAGRGWRVDRYTLSDVAIEQARGYSPAPGLDPSRAVQIVATAAPPDSDPPREGRSLILQGHIDVVPTGPTDMWSVDPFDGEVKDGWLYGRGAQDMKAGLSASVFALDAIRTAGLSLRGRVHVQSVTEEEATGNGALSTLSRGYGADACLIAEPTSNTITRAQCGAIWFRLVVRGKPVHVARSGSGSNAILSAYRLIRALEELTTRLNEEARGHPWFAAVDEPIRFNPGIIRGGDWASSTPSWCEVDCRLGVLPGTSLAAAREAIAAAVHRAAADDPYLAAHPPEIVWNGFQAEGAVLEPGSDAEAVLAHAHRQVFGRDMEARYSTAVNDTRFYALYGGIPSLCYGPAGKGMHGVDERADLANLKETTLVIALFAAAWCGVVERPPQTS
jgi:acetylornithine deacetylase